MKIALISSAHCGSLFPLIKRLLGKGYEVDYYLISGMDPRIEGVDYKIAKLKLGINQLFRFNCAHLFEYMNNENFNFYIFRLPRPYASVPIVRNIVSIRVNHYIRQLIKIVNSKNYGWVNFVGRYECTEFVRIIEGLNNNNIVVSLHEVCNHLKRDFSKPSPLIRLLAKQNIPIVVHSKNSYSDLLEYRLFKKESIHLIHFGLFETFSTIPQRDILQLPNDYILFYGYINPYKGLDILYNAIKQCKSHLKGCKVVVAGAGHVDALDKIKNDDSFVCINHFLSNTDLVELVRGSKFVVCPYRSVSQSGIPQTVYPFGKPIIATDLEGFREVIVPEVNGLLFEKDNAEQLANQIVQLLDKDYCSKIQSNIEQNWSSKEEYHWDYIVNQYLKLI